MAFTFKLILSGLMAFVPNSIDGPNELYVLAIDGQRHAGHESRVSLPHTPYIEVLCANIDDNEAEELCNGLELSPRHPEALEVRRFPIGEKYDIVVRPGDVPLQRNQLRFEPSFGRLVDMNVIAPSVSKVRRAFILPDLDESARRELVSRVKLTEGRVLGLANIIRQDKWRFRTANGFFVGEVDEPPTEIEFALRVNAPSVTLVFRRFDRAGKDFSVRLVPVAPGQDVVVRLVNEPSLEDFCREDILAGFRHFRAFYRLSENQEVFEDMLPLPFSPYRERGCKAFRKATQEGEGGGKYPIICMDPRMQGSPFP